MTIEEFVKEIRAKEDDREALMKMLGIAYAPICNVVFEENHPRPTILTTLTDTSEMTDAQILEAAKKIYEQEDFKSFGDPYVTEGLNYGFMGLEDGVGYYQVAPLHDD
jgi:ornithine carbamoyltransferase